MCLESRLWPLASSRWLRTPTTTGIHPVTLFMPPPLPSSSAELRFNSVGPRTSAQPSWVRFILSSPCSACHESSPHRRFTIAGATFSSSSLSSPERRSFIRACHPHGRGKRCIGSAAFFWASVPLPLPLNRRFIFTLPPISFRCGFRQLRYFGRQRRQFSSHSRLWLF